MLTDENVILLENRPVNGKYFKLTFRSRRLSRRVQPGQFLHIQIRPDWVDPFLRRPFSYYRVDKDRIEVLYEVLGRGTALLAGLGRGSTLRVMGPLGKPFTQRIPKKKRVLVAGGVGVPPLVFLAEKNPVDYLLIGTKSKAEVLPKKELARAHTKILYATNDGSYGTRGFVTVLLKEIILREDAENLFIQTCGPTPMMNAVMEMARRAGIPGEASMEETMACGVGACLGCMVKTIEGWAPSCIEGPVFCFDRLERTHA